MNCKFRALTTSKEFLHNVTPLICEGKPTIVIFPNLDKPAYYTVIVQAIEQFTGVIDRLGNEIYVGDIVTVEYGKGQVIFHQGCYMIQWIDDSEALMELVAYSTRDFRYGRSRSDLQKVGNIYGAYELLKK